MALGDWSVFDDMKDRFQKEIENDDSIVTSKSFLKTTKDERIVMEDKKQIISVGDLVVLGDDYRGKNVPLSVYRLTNIDISNHRLPYLVESDAGIEFLLQGVRLASACEILTGWAGDIQPSEDYENRNPYMRELPTDITSLDVYGVLDLFGVKHHQTGQAIKKLLCPGERGSKGEIQDLQEAIKLIKQAIVKLEREA